MMQLYKQHYRQYKFRKFSRNGKKNKNGLDDGCKQITCDYCGYLFVRSGTRETILPKICKFCGNIVIDNPDYKQKEKT